MVRMSKLCALLCGPLAGLLLLAQPLPAAEVAGVRFAAQVDPQGVSLALKGVALLRWAGLFEVYAGAFYLPPDHPGRAWREDLAKQLTFSYLRDLEGEAIAESSISLVKDNLDPRAYAAVEERLIAFCALFRDVKIGDRYSISYAPDRGTNLYLNGKLLGTTPGHDFAIAYFGIWLGDTPLNQGFRDRLLGG